MPVSARARAESVIAKIAADLLRESRAAAGNHLLSKKEAATLESGLLRKADATLREQAGKRVRPEEAADVAAGFVRDAVEQVSHKGPTLLSQAEIRALQTVEPEIGERAAKAYELITGKRVALLATLPAEARATLLSDLESHHGLSGDVEVRNVRRIDGGYSFRVESSAFQGDVFARKIDGRYVVAPKPFSADDYRRVKAAALDFFDRSFVTFMQQWGASDAEIAATRAAFVPTRALLPGEDDPHGGRYPLVFSIANASGSDHGVHAGLSATGTIEVIATN